MDTATALRTRRSRPVLVEPAPDDAELAAILAAAAAAPDHGRLRPWRFVVIPSSGLDALGEAYAAAHAERDSECGAFGLDRTRRMPHRAPMIVAVISSPQPHPAIPEWEQVASAACVAYGVTLAAHALGFGSMWRTGWFGDAPKVRAHLGLAENEKVMGWVYLGTAPDQNPPPRTEARPDVTRLG
jgi:nitroreductase